jgi:hypothetical protein
MLKKTSDGTPVEAAASDTGELKISGAIEVAEGGATEDKQDDQITLLAGGLPAALGAGGGLKVDGSGTALPVSAAALPLPSGAATSALQGAGLPNALTAGGGVKVGLVDALPAGSATIGAVTGPAAAALALDASVTGLSAKLPSAAALSDSLANPTTTLIGSCDMHWYATSSQWKRGPCNSAGEPLIVSKKWTPATASRSTTLQIQRTIAAFSCTPRTVLAWSSAAGYICLANASSTIADGFTPFGGHIYPISAGEQIRIHWEFAESFTTGLVVAHCTQIVSGGALSTVLSTSASCMFTGIVD